MGVDPYHTYYNGGSEISIPIPGCEVPGACTDPYWNVHTYHGEGGGGGTLASALLRSDNVVFAQVSYDVDPENIVKMARALGVNKSPIKPDLSIALGAEDVTPLEMTSAYATLAAGGVYHPPQPIRKVLRNGVPVGRLRAEAAPGRSPTASPPRWTRVLPDNMVTGLGTHRPDERRAAAGRQDRDDRQLRGRLVLRLHAEPRDVRVDGLREGQDPDAQRRGRRCRVGPDLAVADLARLHERRPEEVPAGRLPRRRPCPFVEHQVDLHYGHQGYYYTPPAAPPSTPTTPTDSTPTDTTSTDAGGTGQPTLPPVGGDTGATPPTP